METRDLDRIRFVTRHFHDLQGLRYWVPLGLITLGLGGAVGLAGRPLAFLSLVLFLGAFLLMLGARWSSRKTLGQVERQPVHPIVEVGSVSIFSPAGPTPRVEGFPLVTPAVQPFLAILGLAFVLFFIFQAISPTILIVESQVHQPPWVTLDAIFEADPAYARGIKSVISPRWISPSTAQAVAAQTIYVLVGSFFLGLWLWRERHPSQRYHLALAVLLLGLAAFGTSLGFLVWEDREAIVRIINLFLTAVVRPWLALLVCGSAMILAGLLDHWQLVRALDRPAGQAV